MDKDAFEAKLDREGYVAEYGELAAGTSRPLHSHGFDVAGLVLAGALTLTCNGERRTYRAGEVYTMAAGVAHAEEIGPDGFIYLVGRRAG